MDGWIELSRCGKWMESGCGLWIVDVESECGIEEWRGSGSHTEVHCQTLTVFTQRNFVSHFLRAKCDFRWKLAVLHFWDPFGGLRGNVRWSS